ncbi:unnamed protein product, partial [Prorocentrum cordatum]
SGRSDLRRPARGAGGHRARGHAARVRDGAGADEARGPRGTPYHPLCVQILQLLQKEGLIRGFNVEGNRLSILLKHYQGAPVIRNIRVVSKPSRDIWLLPHELKFRTRFNTGPRGVRCGEPGGCSAGGGRRRAAARRRRRGRPRPWRSRTRTWSSTFSAERTAAAASARAALLEAGVLIRASEAPGGRDHLCGSAQSAALSGPASSPPVAPGLLLLIRALRPLICICLNYTHCITLPSHFSMF